MARAPLSWASALHDRSLIFEFTISCEVPTHIFRAQAGDAVSSRQMSERRGAGRMSDERGAEK